MDLNTAVEATLQDYEPPTSLGDLNIDELLYSVDGDVSSGMLFGANYAHIPTADKVVDVAAHNQALDEAIISSAEELPERLEVDEGLGNRSEGYHVQRSRPILMCSNTLQQVINPHDRRATIEVQASLTGLFFRADKPASTPDLTLSSEITCYRRNLFKVYATVSMPQVIGDLKLAEDPSIGSVVGLTAQVRATENLKGSVVNIIRASPKNNAFNDLQPLPVSIRLDQLCSGSPVLISWERLQFRHSTTKVPRAAIPRQHYRIIVEVMATLSGGQMISLSRSESPPIIVRGRSPKSYLPEPRDPVSQADSANAYPCLEPVASALPGNTRAGGADPIPGAGNDSHTDGMTASVQNPHDIPLSMPDMEMVVGDYSYISMPISDWSPPVDAVFRPHRVHHKKTTSAIVRPTTKRRYYVQDDSKFPSPYART
ncbi:hypothetical protein BDV26DRAFT_266440 [Aspergillus bertholletiae]|uniref:NDT80 domain-containing protein n=1 Tax=Aspergillus bertholletiae TaxID=1226010 RepID=A0A5N7B3T0_9EURO|nr:hypothetical protein BDV26DRAFT_266440 [Aspergillus bertholletiae]